MVSKQVIMILVTTAVSVYLYGLVQDYLTRNYPDANPILVPIFPACAAALGVYYIRRWLRRTKVEFV